MLVQQALQSMSPLQRVKTIGTINGLASLDTRMLIGVVLLEYKSSPTWLPVIQHIEEHADTFETFLQEMVEALQTPTI